MAAAANRVDITSHTQGSHRSSSLAVISTGMVVARVSVEATTLSLPAAMGATDSPGWPLPEWDTGTAFQKSTLLLRFKKNPLILLCRVVDLAQTRLAYSDGFSDHCNIDGPLFLLLKGKVFKSSFFIYVPSPWIRKYVVET